MPTKMAWLVAVLRLAITPVFLGALVLWLQPQWSGRDIVVGCGLALLGGIHVLYWSRPWPTDQRRAVVAVTGMVLINATLLHVLNLSQPLLWLYPALVVGAGLQSPTAVVGVGLMAVAAVLPVEMESMQQIHTLGRGHTFLLSIALGPGHAILLAVGLAGLGMAAVRQLIAVNTELFTTKTELAALAVVAERARLAHELHDLLGRTLSLIAVKAELAGRLSASSDFSAAVEMRDVQQLAREAIREVRDAVSGGRGASVDAELAAVPTVLRMAGIEAKVDAARAQIDPAQEAIVAWTIREAVTNVLKHSGARACRVSLATADGVTMLEVIDDGHGTVTDDEGTGLQGLAERVHAIGGTFEAGPSVAGGWRLQVRLGSAVTPGRQAMVSR